MSAAQELDRQPVTGWGWHPEPELIDFRDPVRSRARLRALGEDAWRLGLEWLYDEALRRPVGPETYPDMRARFFGIRGGPSPAPESPTDSTVLLDEVRSRLVPYQFSPYHAGSLAYFTPPPLPIAVVAETLSALWQQSVDVWHIGPAAALVEEEVIGWLRSLIGFDEEGWGVLTSGGGMANTMALVIARDRFVDRESQGLGTPPNVRVYASDQAHFSIRRTLRILGFPAETLRIVEADERFQLRAGAVEEAIQEDLSEGFRPLAIVANAGTTNTGAIDELGALADLAAAEDVWFHVDAAYGGAALFSPALSGHLVGIERADSVTVDPHKWFFQPHGVGGVMVRRRDDLFRSFAQDPEYLRSSSKADDALDWFNYTMEGTRPFRALKLWLSWKHLGSIGFRALVEYNVALADHLRGSCSASPDFEAIPAEAPLSVVCFRHLPAEELADDQLDQHQLVLQRALEASGRGWVSTTRLRRRAYLRAGMMNHMTTPSDVDQLLTDLRELAEAVRGRGR